MRSEATAISESSVFANPGVGIGSTKPPVPSGIRAYDLFGGTGSQTPPEVADSLGSPGVGSRAQTSQPSRSKSLSLLLKSSTHSPFGLSSLSAPKSKP